MILSPATWYLHPPGTPEQAVSDAPETFPLDATEPPAVAVAEPPKEETKAEPAEKKAPRKKAPVKAAGKKKETPKKDSTQKGKAKPAAKKESSELRLTQKRVLAAFVKYTVPPGAPPIKGGVEGMTIPEVAKKAGLCGKVTSRATGPYNVKSRAAHDKKYGFRSLLSLGLIRVAHTEEGLRLAISAAGRKYWDTLGIAKLPPKHPGPQSSRKS